MVKIRILDNGTSPIMYIRTLLNLNTVDENDYAPEFVKENVTFKLELLGESPSLASMFTLGYFKSIFSGFMSYPVDTVKRLMAIEIHIYKLSSTQKKDNYGLDKDRWV